MRAENGIGYVTSDSTLIQLPGLTPQGMTAPINLTALSSSEIYVQWQAPGQPNGVIDQYRVLLNAGTSGQIEHGVGVVLETTINGLTPYTEYTVRIAACLSEIIGGCGIGAASEIRTLESPPQMQPSPQLDPLSPSVVMVTWDSPMYPNGEIFQYLIHRRSADDQSTNGLLINDVAGTVHSYRNSGPDLQPYNRCVC